jgi:hypothetical protein
MQVTSNQSVLGPESRVGKMMLIGKAAVVSDGDGELISQSRTTIVRVPRSLADELFGGWGVRI